MTNNRWIKTFLSGSILIILIVSGINYFINPYNIFRSGYDKKFPNKSNLLSGEMTTFYVANRIKPKTIMVGTSRIGLFPAEQLTQYKENPIYNLSLPGSTIDEQAAYVEYMVKYHRIKNVIWSLDFFSFNPTKPIDSSFDAKRLSNHIDWDDYKISLFSFQTLNRSIKTVENSFLISPTTMRDQPFSREQVEANIHSTLAEYAREKTFLKSESFKTPSSIDKKILVLQKTILFCREHNVTCTLYTSPVYYKHIDMYYSIGLGNTFEYWKKSLADIQPYTDFCTYNTLSFDTMKFRDSSHAISSVGKLVFARIFNSKTTHLLNDFGYTATPQNITQHLNDETLKKLRRTGFKGLLPLVGAT